MIIHSTRYLVVMMFSLRWLDEAVRDGGGSCHVGKLNDHVGGGRCPVVLGSAHVAR